MANMTEQEEKLTKELNRVIKRLYNELDGDEETKVKAIQSKVETVISEAIKTLKQTKEKGGQRAEKRRKREEKEEMFLAMAENLETTKKMMEVTGYSQPTVSRKLRGAGIYSRTKVIELLETQTNEQIASEGNVNTEAVARIRKEKNAQREEKKMRRKVKEQEMVQVKAEAKRKKQEEQERARAEAEKKRKEEQEKLRQQQQQKTQVGITRNEQEEQQRRKAETAKREEEVRREEQEFMKMAKDLTDPVTMASKLGRRISVIYGRIEYYGFFTRKDVVPLLSRFSDEEIAIKGKLNVSAVEEVRRQELEKENRANTPEAERKLLNEQRIQIASQNEFLRMAKKYKSIEEWEGKSGVSKYEIILGIRRLLRKGVATSEQVELLQQWEKKKSSEKVSPKKREIDLKIERRKLKGEIKNIGLGNKVKKDLINHIINKILVEYEEILSQEDYALIAYAYMKIREFYKGIELSKAYLGLEDMSVNGVRKKIDQVLQNESERKDNQPNSESKKIPEGEEK